MLILVLPSIQNNTEVDTASWCGSPGWWPGKVYPTPASLPFGTVRPDSHAGKINVLIWAFSQPIVQYPEAAQHELALVGYDCKLQTHDQAVPKLPG